MNVFKSDTDLFVQTNGQVTAVNTQSSSLTSLIYECPLLLKTLSVC